MEKQFEIKSAENSKWSLGSCGSFKHIIYRMLTIPISSEGVVKETTHIFLCRQTEWIRRPDHQQLDQQMKKDISTASARQVDFGSTAQKENSFGIYRNIPFIEIIIGETWCRHHFSTGWATKTLLGSAKYPLDQVNKVRKYERLQIAKKYTSE